MAKLTGRMRVHSQETINEIYRLWDTGEYGYQRIANMVGIPKATVRYWIKKREQDNA